MLSYDINGDDLVVKCDPKLPSYVYIDEQNNIFVNVLRNASDLIKEDLTFHLGSKDI